MFLDEAEEGSYADPELLQQVESSAEVLAEAFITMKEAKTRLANVRKDRGFRGPGRSGKGSGKGKSADEKKQSGKYP